MTSITWQHFDHVLTCSQRKLGSNDELENFSKDKYSIKICHFIKLTYYNPPDHDPTRPTEHGGPSDDKNKTFTITVALNWGR